MTRRDPRPYQTLDAALNPQPTFEDYLASVPAKARGETFDQERDGKRLTAQAMRVYNLMIDGQSRTLAQISAATDDPPASISARLREIRAYGLKVPKDHLGNGLWTYRVMK